MAGPIRTEVALDSEWLTATSLLDLPELDSQDDDNFTVEDLFPELSVL